MLLRLFLRGGGMLSCSVTSDSLRPYGLWPPGSSVHGILQARILQCAVIPPPGDFPDPGIKPEALKSPALAGRFFTTSLNWKTLLRAAAAAKSLQSCPTLCNPKDGSPPGSPIPGILQARTPEWVAISFSNAWKWKVKVKLLSRVRLSATPWTAAY